MAHGSPDFFAAIDPVANREFYGVEKERDAPQWSQIFKTESDDEPTKSAVEFGGPQFLDLKAENAAVTMKQWRQSNIKNWTTSTFAAGVAISFELAQDLKYAALKSSFQSIGMATLDTPEYLARDFLDRAFNSSYPQIWDALELCSTAHLLPDGVTTFANESSSPGALSEAMQEDVMTSNRQQVGPNGLRRPEVVRAWVVPSALYNRAQKLSMSEKTIGSAHNDPSVVKGIKVIPNDYLTSNTRYFALTKNPRGLFWDWIKKAQFITDQVPLNLQKVYVAYFRSRMGCVDPRAIWGVAATS